MMDGIKDFVQQGLRQTHHSTSTDPPVSPVLVNLMKDTSAPVLIFLAEQYGLRRIPGLSVENLVQRILTHLNPDQLVELEQELIAARFGGLSVRQLLDLALESDARRLGTSGKPRLDQMSPADAILVESSPLRWTYTMRGHYVEIDLAERRLSCDCYHFNFTARRMALCKHLAMALNLIPQVYARNVLIDLLVSRDYGSGETPDWEFVNRRAA